MNWKTEVDWKGSFKMKRIEKVFTTLWGIKTQAWGVVTTHRKATVEDSLITKLVSKDFLTCPAFSFPMLQDFLRHCFENKGELASSLQPFHWSWSCRISVSLSNGLITVLTHHINSHCMVPTTVHLASCSQITTPPREWSAGWPQVRLPLQDQDALCREITLL